MALRHRRRRHARFQGDPGSGGEADPLSDATGTVALGSVNDFLETVGVNTHMYYTATPDNAYESHQSVVDALVDLKFRYIRDQYVNNAQHRTWLGDLGDLGIKCNLLFDNRFHNFASIDAALDSLVANNATDCVSVEGPNEWDNNAGAGATDAERMAAAAVQQQLLAEGVLARPALADKWVIAPSTAASDANEFLDVEAYCTHANMHSYPGDDTPSADTRGVNASLQGRINWALTSAPGRPIAATETGYHNATLHTGGHRPVSERASGIYIPQLYFEYFRRGVKRSFIYELVNERLPDDVDNQEEFGFFNYPATLGAAFTDKPHATIWRRIRTLLDDSAAAPTGRLNFTITGGPGTLRNVLMRQSDGKWWIAVWNNVQVWNRSTGTATDGFDLFPSNVSVTLNLGTSRSVTVYQPETSLTPVSGPTTGTSHSLSVAVCPLLVKVG